jgi:hypothetical protein
MLVVVADVEADAALRQHDVAAFDGSPRAVRVLIDGRRAMHEPSARPGRHDQAAGAVDSHVRGALDRQCNVRRRGSWTDDEVVLQLPLVTVVCEVHVGVDVLVFDARVCRNAGPPCAPIAADEMIRPAGQLIAGGRGCVGSTPNQAHRDPLRFRPAWRFQNDGGVTPREIDGIPGA